MFTHSSDICFLCHKQDTLITDISEGNITCTACGAVQVDHIIDEQNESRNIKEENGGNQSLSRLGTAIDLEYFNSLTGAIQIVAKKNKKLKTLIYSKEINNERYLKSLFIAIENIADKFNIQKIVVDRSKAILKKLVDNNKINKSNELYMMAIILRSECLNEGVTLTFMEICVLLELDMKKIKKYYKKICYEISHLDNDKKTLIDRFYYDCNIMFINKYIPTLSDTEKSTIKDFGKFVIENEILSGKNPKTVIATVFLFVGYMINQKNIKIENLSKATGISKTAILNSYNILMTIHNSNPEYFSQFF